MPLSQQKNPEDNDLKRIQVRMDASLLKRIDSYKFEQRLPTRAAAIRKIIETFLDREKE